MNKDEIIHNLNVLIELELSKILNLIDESYTKNKENEKEDIIKKFIEELPDYIKNNLSTEEIEFAIRDRLKRMKEFKKAKADKEMEER